MTTRAPARSDGAGPVTNRYLLRSRSMRIFVAGATGVLGRELLPMLAGRTVFGMTRRRPDVVRALGGQPVVADVYDRPATRAALVEARPEVVVHLLTDLGARDFAANARIRREGTPNLVDAAVDAGARRLVVESIAFATSPDGAAAVDAMERAAHDSGLDAVVVRLGRLWGPGTWNEERPAEPGFVHVREAARQLLEAVERSPD